MARASDRIDVVAGILRNAEGQILLAQRVADCALHGLWEFPGGKIVPGESAPDALRRELAEELGVVAARLEHFHSLEHHYPDRHVALDFYLVRDWSGAPRSCEGQRLTWRYPDEVDESTLLAADLPVLARLRASVF